MNSLTLSLYFFSLVILAASAASDSELRSLSEFKKGIQTDPLREVIDTWTLTSLSTLPSHSCPPWTGISCDAAGNVVAISLDGLGLGGELKLNTLTPLTALQNLTLSDNDFTGRVPPALGTMSSLQRLDLSGNRFYGPIPARLYDLWGLNYLNLSANNFKGGFPGRLSWNLNNLRVFDLHSNQLWGDVADLFSQLRNADHVDLSRNEFFGGLQMASENVSSLSNTVRYLNLSHNKLAGGFFRADSIGLFRNLQVLDLSGNNITGELPSSSFGSLANFRVLRLGSNQLFGEIPRELFESSGMAMEELDLSGNAFTGNIVGINSTMLKVLNLSSNGLTGKLQSVDLRSCVVVDLSGNKLSGDISIMQSLGGADIEVLNLSSNKFSGSFPNLTLQFERLTTLGLRDNLLVGSLPSSILESCPRLSAVDLSLNGFRGFIPGSFFSSTTLTRLNLSGNRLTGPIPREGAHVSELLSLPPYLPIESLDLSNNSLSGGLPRDIGNMVELRLLNLANNDFVGELPSELSKLNKLEYLDLSDNKFKGGIPERLPSNLSAFNVSNNDLSGSIPKDLERFPMNSFHPGNDLLNVTKNNGATTSVPGSIRDQGKNDSARIAIIVASVGVALMIVFVLLAYHQTQIRELHGRCGFGAQDTGRDVKTGRFTRPSLFNFHTNVQPPPSSLSFSNDHLLTSQSRSLSGQGEFVTEISEQALPGKTETFSAPINLLDDPPTTSGRKSSGSPLSSSPRFMESHEQPVILDVNSPDRLAGELFFLNASLQFTAEELSRAPAEVLGRSSYGTLYKATLDSGHILTVKWLRVGLVKHKKDFAKEVKRIGSIKHPDIVPLRAYYWGPREQERLLLADYVQGDSLALHLYETTPRRYSPLSFNQRLKVAREVAQCLLYLHDRGLPHGNLKPTNVLLEGPDYNARLSDYSLHRLMTPGGIAEQILTMGVLGYRAPELATANKPVPSFKADVYAYGVILMELLTRRSASDIISGQSGAVDLTDWVQLCDREGRGMDCIDRDIAGGEEPSKAMDELLATSLRCILPVHERPNIRQVFEDVNSISI